MTYDFDHSPQRRGSGCVKWDTAECGPHTLPMWVADMDFRVAEPIIEALRVPLAGQRLVSVQGILNGTSNYILSEMSTNGLDFDTALKQAQALGYAEADPTLDIDGQDAAHKLTLLIRLAFGVNYPYTVLPVQGIRGMDARDIAMAREFGYRIKLLAEVKRVNLDEGDFRDVDE